ncbi:MAG: TonB-dependent receptor [bacterium]
MILFHSFLRYGLLTLLTAALTGSLRSQQTMITGYVKDSLTGQGLSEVNIDANKTYGASTNEEGFFQLAIPPGEYHLTFSYIGYRTGYYDLYLTEGQHFHLTFSLLPQAVDLDVAVITAGRYEQRLSDVSVSMSVMKPAFIRSINTVDLDYTLNYMPGLDILDGQASIRGGGGYSYGAGSRVSVLVDDLPMLTAAESDVKWNFLPVEEIGQVEVLKGASSALYGSSALNGVINIRRKWPGLEPETKLTLWGGLYQKPERQEMSWWWDDLPLFAGANFSHARKIGRLDLVVGGNGYFDQGYRRDNFGEQLRLNARIRYRPGKVNGLSYGIGTSFQWQHRSDFLIWIDADSGAFLQNEQAVNIHKGIRLNVDPWIIYHGAKDSKHSFRSRYYRVTNNFDANPENDNASDLIYGEYQYQKTFVYGLSLTAGIAGTFGLANANLYGDHQSTSLALFAQADYKFFERLSATLGLRWEQNSMDNTDKESGTVVRAGLNYQAAEQTFIRASYGQGYRFPSIAERHTATSLGALNVFPNPALQSETGWSAEMGVKQGFRINNWSAFLDLAAFWTEYSNMIEFTFGVYKPDSVEFPTLDHVGFKSLNVGRARINGFDVELRGDGKIGRLPLTLFMGYTYMNPLDLSNDTLGEQILKYRYRHSFKGDVSFQFAKITAGISFIYRSYMERIDAAFEEKILGQEIFPGLKDYREENDRGAIVFDARLSYLFHPSARVGFIVKNLFNKE